MIIDHRKKKIIFLIQIFYVPYTGMGKNFDNALYKKKYQRKNDLYIYI